MESVNQRGLTISKHNAFTLGLHTRTLNSPPERSVLLAGARLLQVTAAKGGAREYWKLSRRLWIGLKSEE
ncbi:hypothetical protein VNO77_41535 [Canavalia gladiata]|uniref:Uncharacterized protein n=1 Tax=Canavalia gladiata TaxID=3824 RepID=A0AAN9K0X1_CANGL